MREDAINVVIFALLTFPSTEFDLEDHVITIAPYVTDQKKRVRQASMECIALLSQCLGPTKVSSNVNINSFPRLMLIRVTSQYDCIS